MKAHTGIKNSIKMIVQSVTIVFSLAAAVSASAETSARRPVDPSGPFAKRAGMISQLESVYESGLPESEGPLVGNATIISPCRVITNFHVAFGKSKKKDTKKVVFVKNRAKGHVVNFGFDLDAKTGQYRKTVKAKVVGFANYMATDRGTLGDMAVLELETCLDAVEYQQLDLAMAESRTDVPVGALMTVSSGINAEGKHQIFVQEGCKSEAITPVDGLFVTDCEAVAGMSGSAVYELGKDKKWHWTGLAVKKGVTEEEVGALIAINAKTIANFFTQSFGDAPMAIAPLANDDRKPQSEQTAMATAGRTVVR